MNNNKQTEEEIKEFVNRLPLLVMNNINFLFYEMLPLCGVGPTIAFSRYLALSQKIVFGSYALVKAYIKDHKNLFGADIENSLWVRTMYFENAIDEYNKVVDYVYIILYFNFELYRIIDNEEIKTKDDIDRFSKKIKYDKLKLINKWINENKDMCDFSNKFDEYRHCVKEVRTLANDMKHRGNVTFQGLELERVTRVTKPIDGDVIDITEQVSGSTINLDTEIEKLVEIHNHTIELQKMLYSICGFQKRLDDFLHSNGINNTNPI